MRTRGFCPLFAAAVCACAGAPHSDVGAPAKVVPAKVTPAKVTPATATPAKSPERFTGRVLNANGSPGSGVVVVISDPVKGGVLATMRTGDDGSFATDLAPADYAVTATDADESAYVPSIDGRRGPVEIRLESGCHRIDGRIDTRSQFPKQPFVRLSRTSKYIGDQFGAAVAADGSFHACVPAATYVVKPPDGFVARVAIAVVPYPRSFEFRTDAQDETDRIAPDMSGITPESREAFVAALPAATKVIGLAESNHGTREFYDERTALAMSLASKHGVRLLMLEAGYGETLALDDYVNGTAVDIGPAVQQLGYWIWDTKTFLQTLSQLRAYNARVSPDKRIHVIGIDVQTTAGAIKYLTHSATASLSSKEVSALEQLAVDSGKAWTKLAPDDRASVRATLGRVAATRRTGGVSSKASRTALAAESLLFRFDIWEATNEWSEDDVRDAGMARMALDALASQPKGRATVWAHLAHLSREFVVGQRPMGAHLAAALGDGYRAYALLALAGSARAWDNKHEVGVIAKELATAPAHSLESALATQSAGAHVSYWTFARATGEAARWLKGVHRLRWFGAVFMRDGNEFDHWDLESFDGAILFDSVSPTVPTATGERRATPKPN